MAAGSRDGTLLIWFGVEVVIDTRHHAAVTCLCALEDGHWASGDAAGVVIKRHGVPGCSEETFKTHPNICIM